MNSQFEANAYLARPYRKLSLIFATELVHSNKTDTPQENRNLELYYLHDKINTKGYLNFYMTYSGTTYDEKAL